MPIEVVRVADDILLAWPEQQLAVEFARLRETDAGLIYGELSIETKAPPKPGKIYGPQRLCLNQAGQELKRLSDYLTPRLDKDWQGLMSALLLKTVEAWREPEPLAVLADTVAPPETEYLFHPLVPLGETTVVMADRESGKSYLAQGLMVSVATGKLVVPGFTPNRTGLCIYYDFETEQPSQWRRALRICNGLGLPGIPRNLRYRQMHGPIANTIKQLIADVQRNEAVAVVIDSLGWACGGDLNSPEAAIRTMDAIRQLPCTRIVLAHYAKAHRNGEGQASVFGSAFFEAAPRAIWEVRKPEDEPENQLTMGLYQRKMSDDGRHAPMAVRIQWDRERNSAQFVPAQLETVAELEERLPLHQRLRRLLQGGDRDTVWLAEQTGVGIDTAGKTLRRMADAVRVSESAGGRSKAQTWHLKAVGENPDTPIYKSVRVSDSGGPHGPHPAYSGTQTRTNPDVSRNGTGARPVPRLVPVPPSPVESELDADVEYPF